jgi:hypothetical protein
MNTDNKNKVINNTNTVIEPFTYEWWMTVGKRAYNNAESFSFRSYMYDVAEYCKYRAYESECNMYRK